MFDLQTYFKLMERCILGFFGAKSTSEVSMPNQFGKHKKPMADRNLSGSPVECPHCGIIFWPQNKKDFECPFCGRKGKNIPLPE